MCMTSWTVAESTSSVVAPLVLELVALHSVGDILGKFQYIFVCISRSAFTLQWLQTAYHFDRKTNQFGLTSDTVKLYNIVLMVGRLIQLSRVVWKRIH